MAEGSPDEIADIVRRQISEPLHLLCDAIAGEVNIDQARGIDAAADRLVDSVAHAFAAVATVE